MTPDIIDKYFNYYLKNPPFLDEYELKYFECLFKSNEEFIRSSSFYELYRKYGLTRYFHYVIYTSQKSQF